MRIKNISYPHPVLGNGDDVKGKFNVKFSHELYRDRIVLKPSFSLHNKTLEKLLADRNAAFTVEIECNSTFYRDSFKTFSKVETFDLASEKVREQVIASFYIRAAENIPNYIIEGCHEDYDGFSFDIRKGDVLALGGMAAFIAEKDFDPLRPAVSALIAINKGSEKNGPAYPDYESDKIVIRVSEKDYNNYIAIKGRKAALGILHATIVLPVLAEAIEFITGGKRTQDFSQYHWFSRLEIILQRNGLISEDPLVSSQKILGLPIGRSLKGTVDIFEENIVE